MKTSWKVECCVIELFQGKNLLIAVWGTNLGCQNEDLDSHASLHLEIHLEIFSSR